MNHLKRPKHIWYLFGIFLAFSLLFVIYVFRTSPQFNQYEIVREHSVSNTKPLSSTKHILLWNSFFGDKRWSLPEDTLSVSHFQYDLHCPVYDCELTNEHDFLSSVDLYDSIVFHTAEAFPLLHPTPTKRRSKQFYVFALMEPPGETKHVLSDEGGFYNLTMTYRLDSDIVWPYNQIVERQTNRFVAPAKNPKWLQNIDSWNSTELWTAWKRKTKMAAWFVSHCNTLSKREALAEALQKYIEVDIYGKCGPKSCERYSDACDEMLDNDYKFYLAFENSLCTDYVTEKLYNVLKRNIIPVVYGGANYTRFLPPHSYIDVEQFDSVKDLAAYLQNVANNPDEYVSYFWWRNYYRLGYQSPFCDLCEILHSKSFQMRTQSYNNIEEWWLGDSCRFEHKIEY